VSVARGVPLLRMEGITKSFPGVLANDAIDFEVAAGEVHALLGENGSGKTTLMNILYGMYRPDAGRIVLRGRAVHLEAPRDAIRHGVGMVHQHFMLVAVLTVAQNVVLALAATERHPGQLVDQRAAEARIAEMAVRYRMPVDPRALVWQLPVGVQQRVEILKALLRGADLLILDEPTAVLTPTETVELFRTLRVLADEGRSVVFITHKLAEVMETSDRVTVLRAGRVVDTVDTARTTPAALARMMVGRDLAPPAPRRPGAARAPVLTVEALRVRDDRALPALRGVSFTVHAGEILGVAGVDGNGQRELAEAIAGLRHAESGRVVFADGETGGRPRARVIAHIPEDRRRTGLIGTFTVAENLILKTYDGPAFARWWGLDLRAVREATERAMREFDIRAAGPDAPATTLSGGNQQKLILARELGMDSRFVLAVQPTRGLDVGAIDYVHRRLVDARDRGAAILLISTDLEETMTLSDRVLVLYEGGVMGVLPREAATRDALGPMMAGTPLDAMQGVAP
jgi:general nucleoside transport system ATP-binding protein